MGTSAAREDLAAQHSLFNSPWKAFSYVLDISSSFLLCFFSLWMSQQRPDKGTEMFCNHELIAKRREPVQ